MINRKGVKCVDKLQLIDNISKLVLEEIKNSTTDTSCTSNKKGIPIGVSARHVHLSQEDVEKLFGIGHALTPFKELMGGEYAAKETVMVVGTKLRPIENVRVLGPVRKQTQVEVSKTDAVRLGLKPPIRLSGDLAGSTPVTLVGPKGAVNLTEGCIVAMRHIHMAEADAQYYGVKSGQEVTVKTLGGRGGSFNHVQVRVDNRYRLEMHLDTDEANGLGISCKDEVEICF